MPVNNLIQVRRGTAAQWVTADPALESGEIGFETDTGKFKIGDGATDWLELKYAGGSGIEVSETAPEDPDEGALWFNSSNAITYIYYDSYWVELTPAITGPRGPQGIQGVPGEPGEPGPAGSDANTDELYALTLMGAI
jgi:hypothetical protein